MILFVDEERRRMSSYVEACHDAGLEVKFVSDVDSAWDSLSQDTGDVELVVLDVMLPPGKQFDRPSALDGIRTGLEFYHDLREAESDLPVILFTQSGDHAIDDVARNDPFATVRRKQFVLPGDLPAIVREMVGARRQKEGARRQKEGARDDVEDPAP